MASRKSPFKYNESVEARTTNTGRWWPATYLRKNHKTSRYIVRFSTGIEKAVKAEWVRGLAGKAKTDTLQTGKATAGKPQPRTPNRPPKAGSQPSMADKYKQKRAGNGGGSAEQKSNGGKIKSGMAGDLPIEKMEITSVLDKLWNSEPGRAARPDPAEQLQMKVCKEPGSLWILRRTPDIKRFYELDKIMGQPGAFGTVREAKRISDNKMLACKMMKKFKYRRAERTQEYFDDIREEVRLMYAACDHKNIITVEEVFEDVERIYIIMEPCAGGELLDYINSGKKKSEREASGVVRQLFNAIYFLHSKNIAHRDVKPENYLLKGRTVETGIRLIDFGMSKVIHWREYLGAVKGSPFYVAPEVLGRKSNVASDIWSLGVVCFMIIFGFPPFYDQSGDDGIYKMIRRGFIPEVRPGWGRWFPQRMPVSAAARDFIARCLTLDVADRITAEEALEHPWLRERQSMKQLKPIDDAAFINSLTCFKKKRCHLQNDLLDFLKECKYLNKTQEKLVQRAFEKMDQNHDGCISQIELQMALRTIDPKITEQDAKSIMLSLDVNSDGTLDYSEVLESRINRKLISREARLRKLFDELDQNQSGSLDPVELKAALNHVEGKNYSTAQVSKFMGDVDSNRDGEVDYEEFLGMWVNDDMRDGLSIAFEKL